MQPAWGLERCLEEIERNAGRQFEPALLADLHHDRRATTARLTHLAVGAAMPDPALMPVASGVRGLG